MDYIKYFLSERTLSNIMNSYECLVINYSVAAEKDATKKYCEKLRLIEKEIPSDLVSENSELFERYKMMVKRMTLNISDEEIDGHYASFNRNEMVINSFFRSKFDSTDKADKLLIQKIMELLFSESIFSHINLVLFRNTSFLENNIQYYDDFYHEITKNWKLTEEVSEIIKLWKLKKLISIAPALIYPACLEKTCEKFKETIFNQDFFKNNQFLIKDFFANDYSNGLGKYNQNIKRFLKYYANINIVDKEYLLIKDINGIRTNFEDFYTLVGKTKSIENELMKECPNEAMYAKGLTTKKYVAILRKILKEETEVLTEIDPAYKLDITLKEDTLDFICHSDVKEYIYLMLGNHFLGEKNDMSVQLREIILNKKLVDKCSDIKERKKI